MASDLIKQFAIIFDIIITSNIIPLHIAVNKSSFIQMKFLHHVLRDLNLCRILS
jgi:hypothetical protein